MEWIKTDESQPKIGDKCLVYGSYLGCEEPDYHIQEWVEHYEVPYIGFGKLLTSEGWEDVEIFESLWMPLPEPPQKQ